MKRNLILLLLGLPLCCLAQIDLSGDWKFKTGDDLAWSRAEFSDSDWKTIRPSNIWESQGYENYDGYAWYRIHFKLPASLKDNAYLKDSIRVLLGRIDDVDEVYLNGEKIGQTGHFPTEKGGYITAWDAPRRYVIPGNHPALRWNTENTISVRVYDGGGGGGMFEQAERSISFVDLIDYIKLDASQSPYDFSPKWSIKKKIFLENKYPKAIDGELITEVFTHKNKIKPDWKAQVNITVKASENLPCPITFSSQERARVRFTFKEKNTGRTRTVEQETPYILTPPEGSMPQINNPDAFGARPGVPFQFTIAVSGKQPMQYTIKGLPRGLKLEQQTGVISGMVNTRGMYSVTITATNNVGSRSKIVNFVIGDNICLTPPLGWNSWNCWGLSVSDAKVRSSAESMIKSGLARHGWNYMNIDDGWEAAERDAKTGEIKTNDKFPDMKGLADYLHRMGLKIGIYSSPGARTCGNFLGTWQHEQQDAQTWAGWGIDYLKYDWCSYDLIAPDKSLPELKKPYEVMRAALNATNRDIVYSMCQYGMGDVWEWGEEVGGNLWRTTGDINDTWESLRDIGFIQHKSSAFSRPGHWNDPDMLTVGWVGWGDHLHQTRLTPSEQYTHISLWAMLSAPMLIGCDLSRIDDFTYNLLANDEVLAIDQDALGKQATQALKKDDYQIWVKELADGGRAIGIFNLSDEDRKIDVNWSELGLKDYKKVRDVWRQKDIGKFGKTFSTEVYAHGVTLVKLY
ncbi:MAG: putative Ig domain-containing protein [Bacteroidota bacterium]